jgi:hypothetical protein
MPNDATHPLHRPRTDQIQRAKDLARQMVSESETDDLQKLFNFADAEWPFDHALKMVFFDEIHLALTARRNSVKG